MMLASTMAFGQTDFRFHPKNSLTVDFGPSIIGSAIGMYGDIAANSPGEGGGIDTDGFGIGLQYERQLNKQLSLAARFVFLRGGLSVEEEGTRLGADFFSYSAEAHVRYYPGSNILFLGGMLGYAGLSVDFMGEAKVTKPGGDVEVLQISHNAPRNFFKLGAKLGWRLGFGGTGGLVFEPSLGYNIGIGFGTTILDQISEHAHGHIGGIFGDTVFYNSLEHFIFVGGPRMTLGLGMRF